MSPVHANNSSIVLLYIHVVFIVISILAVLLAVTNFELKIEVFLLSSNRNVLVYFIVSCLPRCRALTLLLSGASAIARSANRLYLVQHPTACGVAAEVLHAVMASAALPSHTHAYTYINIHTHKCHIGVMI